MSEVTIGFSGLLRMAIRFHRSIAGGRPIPSGFHGRWSDLVDLSEDDRLVFSVYRKERSDLVGASVTLIRFQRHTEDNPYAVVQSVEP